VGKAPYQLQQAAPFKRLAAAFCHYRRNWFKETHLIMLEHGEKRYRRRQNRGRPRLHSATALPGSAVLPLVIPTEAQRSGGICSSAGPSWKCFFDGAQFLRVTTDIFQRDIETADPSASLGMTKGRTGFVLMVCRSDRVPILKSQPLMTQGKDRRSESRGIPPFARKTRRTPDSCHATLDKTACAPFVKERRMNLVEPNKLNGNPGDGAPDPSLPVR
jgi:hypothetical protein